MKNPFSVFLKVTIIGCFALLASGCLSMRWGPGEAPHDFDYRGVFNGYASVKDLRAYDGRLLQVDLFNRYQQNGELLNLDIWPIAGVGVGAFGLRAHLVSLGAGFGTIFYDPVPQGSWVRGATADTDDDITIRIED